MTGTTTFSLALPNEAATAHLMADLALLTGPGDVVTLSGDLGAGKTAAARAMIRYLAGDDTLEVPSPTFTLAQHYDLPSFPLIHADLYRINDAAELEEIGLSPLPEATVALIEWPERAPEALPADRIDIALSHRPALGTNARAAEITGFGKAAAVVERLKALREFLDGANFGDARRQRMAGDASIRSYARLIRDKVFILMNSPKRPDGPAIYDGKSYSAAVHLAEDVKPFVAIAGGLRSIGLSAPAIHHADLDQGFLITEDFGTESVLAGDPPQPIAERYEAATDMLAAMHREVLPDTLPLAPHITYPIPLFDTDAMLVEIGLMPEWYLRDRDAPLSDEARAQFFAMWRELLDRTLASATKTWVMRDFHSPNIIWLGEREGIKRVGIIDFQDAVLGPGAYDVVSLLQDARIDVPEQLELALLSRYIKARRAADGTFDPASFAELYAIMSAQRNTRLLGTFARLNRRDGKPQYLRHQPRIWTYLSRSLAHPALADFRAWYTANVPPPVP
jgi:tRNA threonylcarbamoyl adenosine modification protein YjeE